MEMLRYRITGRRQFGPFDEVAQYLTTVTQLMEQHQLLLADVCGAPAHIAARELDHIRFLLAANGKAEA